MKYKVLIDVPDFGKKYYKSGILEYIFAVYTHYTDVINPKCKLLNDTRLDFNDIIVFMCLSYIIEHYLKYDIKTFKNLHIKDLVISEKFVQCFKDVNGLTDDDVNYNVIKKLESINNVPDISLETIRKCLEKLEIYHYIQKIPS